jgi:membrane-bound lytic murein transglycosylase F
MSRKFTSFYFLAFLFSFCILALLWFLLAGQNTPQLNTIIANKEIRISLLNSPDSYYLENDQIKGFEYELAQKLANELNVSAKITVRSSVQELYDDLESRDSHISIPGVSKAIKTPSKIQRSVSYLANQSVIVYRVTRGIKYPRGLENIIDRKVVLIAGSIQEQQMLKEQQKLAELNWTSFHKKTTYQLLEDVLAKKAGIAIVSALDFQKLSPFFPGLKTAFALVPKQRSSWLTIKRKDSSLATHINLFFKKPSTESFIKELTQKYYSTNNPLKPYDTIAFKKDFNHKFPKIEQFFKKAAALNSIDWQLLAAMAYQESHWNPQAISPTGVKGIMMLTKAAAKEVDVTDRTDPRQNIFGGAQYFKSVKAKIPERIPEPDRTYLALAGYNTGFGHLEDARILTKRAGLDPDKWEDVNLHLPLLTKPKYYNTVKYGYARGYEPVNYVKNIRRYLKVLGWELKQRKNNIKKNTTLAAPTIAEQDKTTLKEIIPEPPSTL